MTDNAELFDGHAEGYEATINSAIGASGETTYYFAKLRAKMIADALRGGDVVPGSVLDFGCGTGNLTREVARVLPRSSVIGTDASTASLAIARERTDEAAITYTETPRDRLSFNSGAFNVVYAQGVFHHIPPTEHRLWVSEIRRCLGPSGRFFLFEHNPYNPLTVHVVKRVPFDREAQLLTPRYAVGLLSEEGFTDIAVRFYFFFPRALSFLRLFERRLGRVPIGAQYVVEARA